MYKVLIRPLELEDASFSWKWRNDPDIWKYTGRKPDIVVTEEVEKQWLLEKISENNSSRFAIIVNDEYVGNIQLTNIIENESAEYHIFIGEKTYWGKGVARLATNQIISYAKNLLNLREIYLFVNPDNIAAIKVYERAGFNKVNDNIKMILSLSETPAPCVSVFMLAYNHEKYIAEAIESVLMQKTNFAIEIIIHDDASTDGTAEILKEYKERYPHLFQIILQVENQLSKGINPFFEYVASSARGKYIALCEGDDYWTDPLKLQKQVDFLEGNLEYSACFHNANVVDSNGKLKRIFHGEKLKDSYDFETIIQGWFVPTASIVFRNENEIIEPMKDISPGIISGDRLLLALIGSKGLIGYLDQNMCAYRKHVGGMSSLGNHVNVYKSNVVLFKRLRVHFKPKYNKVIMNQIFRWHGYLCNAYWKNRSYALFTMQVIRTIVYVRNINEFKAFIKLYLLQKKT